MKRFLVSALLLGTVCCFSAIAQVPHAYRTVLYTKQLLHDAAMRADTAAMRFGIERLKPLTDDPEVGAFANYYLSFAHWQWLFATWSQSDNAQAFAEASVTYAQKAVDQAPEFWDAYGLAILTRYMLARINPAEARTLYGDANALLAKGLTADPTNPYILFPDASRRFFLPVLGGPLASLQRYTALFDGFAHRTPASALHPDWGAEIAYAMLSQSYIYMPNVPPQVLPARELMLKALAIRPDFDLVRNSLLPMTDPILTYMPEPPVVENWTLVTNDALDDHSNKTLADGKALSYHYDAAADSVWFKFDFFSLPDTTVFGLNLVLDNDQDQRTGLAWWGNNTDFMYDKLVTVWAVDPGDGIYRGTVGVGYAEDAYVGRFTSLHRHNIALHVDGTASSIYIGMKRADLDEDGALTLVGAVGSSTNWNDDLSTPQPLTLPIPMH